MATDTGSVDLVARDVVQPFSRAVMIAVLMAVGAWIAIPISAVPGTLQTLVVFLAALYLGPYWGAGTMVLYLATGAVGAPVFAGFTAGFGVLVGSHGGFLFSFPVAAFLMGYLIHRGSELRSPADAPLPLVVVALVAGGTLIYLSGFAWYSYVTGTSIAEAFAVVAAPLIPGDVLKLAAAIAIVRSGIVEPIR